VFYGIFSNKNNVYYYQVIEIEYEHYDSLRDYLKSENSTAIGIFNTSNNKRHVNILDAFAISGKSKLSQIERDIEIEIIKDDFHSPCLLPISSLNCLNNYIIHKTSSTFTNSKYKQIFENDSGDGLKYFQTLYNKLNSNFPIYQVVFLLCPIHTGINYILRKICDENGYFYYTKNMKKFRSIESFIEYLKKIEFRTPCVINFKNAKKLSELINEKQKYGGSNYIEEIKNILNFSRREKNSKIFYYFSFENSTEVDSSIKALAGNNVDYILPDLNTRKELISLALENIINNHQIIFNQNFLDNSELVIKHTEKFLSKDLLSLDNYNLAKLLNGFDLKDLKSFFKLSFENYINKNRKLAKRIFENLNNDHTDFEEHLIRFDINLIEKTFDKIKRSRLKNDKTVCSIPEIKWENVGGLEHAKENINDTIQLPLKYPKLFKSKDNDIIN